MGIEMSTARKLNLMSVEEYLAAELASPVKHEYLGGVVYAMAGARNAHNKIAGNVFGSLWGRLRGQPCQPFNSDTKVRVPLTRQVRFYYPDTSVICRPNPDGDSFQEEPAAIFEVLSRKTRRIDDGEKKDAYLTLPSLSVYVLVEQESPALVAWRRTREGFVREVYEGVGAVLPLGEIGTELPLAEVYAGVAFTPEAEDGDGG
jgi:Uma2 family endonuclease